MVDRFKWFQSKIATSLVRRKEEEPPHWKNEEILGGEKKGLASKPIVNIQYSHLRCRTNLDSKFPENLCQQKK